MKRTRRKTTCHLALAGLAGAFCASSALGQWLEFVKDNSRMQSTSSLGIGDTQEKDYAWADLNKNGWVDLIVMRKQPFTTPGKRQNVLFMNEGGVLVDRSSEYASAVDASQIPNNGSDGYPADQGFLTPTNDRMAAIADFNDNDWYDFATATTVSDGDPKRIAYPRVYMNLGNDGGGNWQGFEFQNDRIPAMCSKTGNCSANPRFCSVTAGDVTNNGSPDLYFGDYDSTGVGGGSPQPAGHDYDNRLLINDGSGHFADESVLRMGSLVFYPGNGNQPYTWSAFGVASVIADMNGNGLNDVVKDTALSNSQHVAVMYNDPNNIGHFINYQFVEQNSPYFVAGADLNNNGRIDLIVVDDFFDGVYRNISTAANGTVNWSGKLSIGSPSGFASNITVVDLDNDEWLDFIIADVDVDITGCNRNAGIYRNMQSSTINMSNQSSIIPLSDRVGTFHVAAFDINGDGWNDMIFGRCIGTDIWMNVPPFSMSFNYPNGLPSVLEPEVATDIDVELIALGGDATNANLNVSVNGGAFTQIPLTHGGGDNYTGQLPAADCGDVVNFYITAEIEGTPFSDPAGAPLSTYGATVVEDIVLVVFEDFDTNDGNFDVSNEPGNQQGEWVHGEPTGAFNGPQLVAPIGDAGGSGEAWVTCLGCTGAGCANACSVTGDATHLLSDVIDLDGSDAVISYDRWMYSRHAGNPNLEDFLSTWVSNDGGSTWEFVHETGGTDGNWESAAFLVSDYVTPTANVVVRFSVDDTDTSSITNAGIDNFAVEELDCGGDEEPCTGDLNDDGNVNVFDLLDLLGAWGDNPGHAADLNGDGVVNVFDLLDLLGAWGACP